MLLSGNSLDLLMVGSSDSVRPRSDATLIKAVVNGTAVTCPVEGYDRRHCFSCGHVAGAYIDGRPVVCTGFDASSCHASSTASKSWEPYGQLDISRKYAAAVDIGKRGWLITGGYDLDRGTLATSAILKDGVSESGPRLPRKVSGHCMTGVNATHVFMAGGMDTRSGAHANAYLLNVDTMKWTSLPDMRVKRWDLGCARISEDEIIVVGGYEGTGYSYRDEMERSEVFSLTSMAWRDGPKDPEVKFTAKWHAFPHEGTVVLVDSKRDSKWVWLLNKEAERFEKFSEIGLQDGIPIALPAGHGIVCRDE